MRNRVKHRPDIHELLKSQYAALYLQIAPVLAQRGAHERMRADLQQQHILGDLGAGQAELHAAGVAVRLRPCSQSSVVSRHRSPRTGEKQSAVETDQRTSMLCA